MICEKCNGKGYFDHPLRDNLITMCPICFGKKNLDWIDIVLGVSFDDYWFPPNDNSLVKRKET